MKITEKWLQENSACREGIAYAKSAGELDDIEILKKLIADAKLDWANWLIVRIMDYKQYVPYAIFAAEQVINNFERKFPADNRPRLAIEAAKKCLKNPSAENRAESAWSESAAWVAAARSAAWAAAVSAEWVAAARSAESAAWAKSAWAAAARSAESAARSAAESAAWAAAGAAGKAMLLKILNYGLKLLEEK